MTPATTQHQPHTASESIRIMETFERLARDVGPRNVSMSVLAIELGMSTKTIYRHFANKAELVTALIRHRATEWKTQRDIQLAAKIPGVVRLYDAAQRWVDYVASVSPEFREQLARDFPAAQQILDAEYDDFMQQGRRNLEGIVRDDLDPDVALHALRQWIEAAADRRYCDEVGKAPVEVLRQHLDMWVRGAVRAAELAAIEKDQPRRGRFRTTTMAIALLSVLATGCGGSAPQSGPLIDHAKWSRVEGANDPFDERRAAEHFCDDAGWGAEELAGEPSLGIDSVDCNFWSGTQPLLIAVEPGQTMNVRVWRFEITVTEPAEAYLGVKIDGQTAWEETVALPAESGMIATEVPLDIAADAGAPLVFHLDNHGENAWSLLELSVE